MKAMKLYSKIEKKNAAQRPDAGALSSSGNDISAPMPGKILKILVKEGQEIAQNVEIKLLAAPIKNFAAMPAGTRTITH